MNRLQAELRRLYQAAPAAPASGDTTALVDAQGRSRAVVLELSGPANWDVAARVWQGVQADLGLPAPAIAVNGRDGYQLWFSMAEAIAPSRAREFMAALQARYWGDIEPLRVRAWPAADGQPIANVPMQDERTAQWSAFVARDLAPVFADSPWLDIPPNPEGQADLLRPLGSLGTTDLERVLGLAKPTAQVTREPAGPQPLVPAAPTTGLRQANPQDPRGFLLAVMNDERIELALRIEAAKALLPYGAASAPP